MSINKSTGDKIMTKEKCDLYIYGTTIKGYSGSISTLTIPEGIEDISQDAFRRKKKLSQVHLPKTLISIGANAFASSGLENVEIPASVSLISISPFCWCSNLENIFVEENNVHYKSVDGVLYGYNEKWLKEYPTGRKQDSYAIPEGVEAIAEKAFAGCFYLKTIVFPKSMSVITRRAFSGCQSLEEVIIPQWVSKIEEEAFAYCNSLKRILVYPTTIIEQNAFKGSESITIEIIQGAMSADNIECLNIKRIPKKHLDEPHFAIVSKGIVEQGIFTSKVNHTLSIRKERNKFGDDEISIDIRLKNNSSKDNIDENGLIKVGAFVHSGDVLVCKGTPEQTYSTPEDRLLRSIFGESHITYRDTSLYVPYHIDGIITKVEKNNDLYTVYIEQTFEITLGDILCDENGQECVVNSFEDTSAFDLSINFDIGRKISKKTVAKQLVESRSTGSYSIARTPLETYNTYNSVDYLMDGVPQRLTNAEINSLIDNGYGDVLANIINYQTDQPNCRLKLYEQILHSTVDNTYQQGIYFLNEFCCLLYALCLKPIFKNKNGEIINFSFSDIKKNIDFNNSFLDDVSLEIAPLTEREIIEISYGEVSCSDTLNYRMHAPERDGLFCEKIFGPVKEYECQCGKYRGIRYKGIVCNKCGVEVATNKVRAERFGYITLATPVAHPFIKGEQITVLPILPPNLRAMVSLNNGTYLTSDLNQLYRSVINHNSRLKRLIEFKENKLLINSEIELLNDCIRNLMTGRSSKGIVSQLKACLAKHLKNIKLDYSACCGVIIDDIDDNKCNLPYKIALELFKPFIMEKLVKASICPNLRIAKRKIEKIIFNEFEDIPTEIIDIVFNVVKNKKLIIIGNHAKFLILNCNLTSNDVLMVSLENYNHLDLSCGSTVKIVFPVHNVAQDLLKNLALEKADCCENDFIKQLSEIDENEFVGTLNSIVESNSICTFSNPLSRCIFNKPSDQAANFYTPAIVVEKSIENGNEDNLFSDNFLDDDEDDEAAFDINEIFEDIDSSEDDGDFNFDDLFNDDSFEEDED